jgi:MFS family permease
MLGAVAGPLLALGLLAFHVAIPTLIVASLVPALLAVFFIVTFTHDYGTTTHDEPTRPSHRLPRPFWTFLVGVLLFGLGDFSRTFLIFLVASAAGGSAARGALTAGVLAYAIHNLVSGIAAFPAGRLGDRIPKWQVLAFGYGLGIATNTMLAAGSTSLLWVAIAVVGSGTYIAVEETIEKAAVAEFLPRMHRSFGFGILACANAVGDMVSSLYVGTLVARGHGGLAFGIAALFGLAGTAWIVVVGRAMQTPEALRSS